MSNYKICKFVDGNGSEWYQIKKKGWLFWSYLSGYEFSPYDYPPLRRIFKFESVEKASEYIKNDIEYMKAGQIKKVNCFDYDTNR